MSRISPEFRRSGKDSRTPAEAPPGDPASASAPLTPVATGRPAMRVIDCVVPDEERFWQAVADFLDRPLVAPPSLTASRLPSSTDRNVDRSLVMHAMLAGNEAGERSNLPPEVDALGALVATVDWTWVTDEEFRYTYVSEAGRRFAGADDAWTSGGAIWEAPWCREPEAIAQRLVRFAQMGRSFREQHIDYVGPDGSVGTLSLSGSPRFDMGGNLIGYAGFAVIVASSRPVESNDEAVAPLQSDAVVARPVTWPLHAGRDVERFKALLEYSNEFCAVVRRDGVVTLACVSSPAEVGRDAEDVIGRALLDLIHPDDRNQASRLFEAAASVSGAVVRDALRITAGGGTWRSAAWLMRNALDVPGINGIVVSVRATGGIEGHDAAPGAEGHGADHADSQAREAIGALAGRLAHNFNNDLAVTLGFAKLLIDDLPSGGRHRDYAQSIVAASERGRNTVQRIMSFARAGSAEPRVEDLGTILRQCAERLRDLLPSRIALEMEVWAEPLIAMINRGKFEEFVAELLANSRDASKEGPGQIRIDLALVESAGEGWELVRRLAGVDAAGRGQNALEVVRGVPAAAARYARLRVTDHAGGMAPQTLARAFDPFFTTRGRGQNLGLGLAIAEILVTAARGACVLRTVPGDGTTVEAWLPLIDGETVESSQRV